MKLQLYLFWSGPTNYAAATDWSIHTGKPYITMAYDYAVNFLREGTFEELMIHELLHTCNSDCLNYLVRVKMILKKKSRKNELIFILFYFRNKISNARQN